MLHVTDFSATSEGEKQQHRSEKKKTTEKTTKREY